MEQGDASTGWGPEAFWDANLLTASVPELPVAFTQSLVTGGRLVGVIGSGPVMEAVRIDRDEGGVLSRISLFDTRLAPLVNASTNRIFQL